MQWNSSQITNEENEVKGHTFAARRKLLNQSQSRSISSSSSWRMSGSRIHDRAASKCSLRIKSMVMSYSGRVSSGSESFSGVNPNKGLEAMEDDERVRVGRAGLVGGLWLWSLPFPPRLPPAPNKPLDGVVEPEADDPAGFVRLRASDAARKSKLVVPRALVDPDRAEQTIATLLSSI